MEENTKKIEGKEIGKYGNWIFTREGRELFIQKRDEFGELKLPLNTHKGHSRGVYGYIEWGDVNIREAEYIVAGTCLFDKRWKIFTEAKKPHKNDGLAELSPASALERQKIFKKLKSGAKVIDVQYPTDVSFRYHERLINWQLMVAKKAKNLKKMVVHIPRGEYHYYIQQLEDDIREHSYFNAKMKKTFAQMHDSVDFMADTVWNMYQQDFKIQEKIEFIAPFEKVKDPINSYLEPYKNPERYGIDASRCIGVEEISEIKLSQATGGKIPVIGAVLDKERPYSSPTFTDVLKKRVNQARYAL